MDLSRAEQIANKEPNYVRDWLQAVASVLVAVVSVMLIRRLFAPTEVRVHGFERVNIAQSTAIGDAPSWYGNEHATYSLIEFADYECPPCRLTSPQVTQLIDSMAGKVRFTFRNYPLHGLHLHADNAAIAAEIARSSGKFWQVHDSLYEHQATLSDVTIRSILALNGISADDDSLLRTSAKERVANDLRDAERCEIHSTPTFLLCDESGMVFRLGALEQVHQIVK